jgi:hypothetical protein
MCCSKGHCGFAVSLLWFYVFFFSFLQFQNEWRLTTRNEQTQVTRAGEKQKLRKTVPYLFILIYLNKKQLILHRLKSQFSQRFH